MSDKLRRFLYERSNINELYLESIFLSKILKQFCICLNHYVFSRKYEFYLMIECNALPFNIIIIIYQNNAMAYIVYFFLLLICFSCKLGENLSSMEKDVSTLAVYDSRRG